MTYRYAPDRCFHGPLLWKPNGEALKTFCPDCGSFWWRPDASKMPRSWIVRSK